MELEQVCVSHLMIDNFSDHVPVGGQHEHDPLPDSASLPEMLRFEVFRLKVQVFTFVVPLVRNLVPDVLIGLQ